jgi:thiamine biosynthesis protein ThiS
MTIAGMLAELGLDASKVAVERNREIVARSLLDVTRVENEDSFEVVHFVGGG